MPFYMSLVIGNVACSAYPIEQLDSINSKTGELNEVSALNLIVFGVRYISLLPSISITAILKWKMFDFYDIIANIICIYIINYFSEKNRALRFD